MIVSLALPEELWHEIAAPLALDVETAGVLLAGVARSEDQITLLGRRIVWVPEDAYEVREERRMVIRSGGYVPALKRAAEDGSFAMFFHTHPNGHAEPSELDRQVNQVLRDPFELRTGGEYASLIVGGTPGKPSFTGVLNGQGTIDRLRIVGSRLRLVSAEGTSNPVPDAAVFDRQIRAFGRDGQELLGSLSVGVVGAGGTGSAVCEELIRMGIRDLVVIDDDVVTSTNLSRIHESARTDVGRPKVDVVADAAARIDLGAVVKPTASRITDQDVAKLLRHCDVIFGCTDDNRGRAILSRMAYWYLIPVIDSAFLVDTHDQEVRGLFGRVSAVVPGSGCLVCRGRIDQAQMTAEALPPDERQRLAVEGYVPGLAEPDPSVGVYTTLIASFAVDDLLARLFGYAGEDPPTELLVRLHDRYLSNRHPLPLAGHYCADRRVWGRGDQDPFLDQLWA